MELRQVHYFVAVAEEMHFSRAAQRLHVSQPAVSGQIRKLEEALGVQLLTRSSRQIALTDAGAAFLGEARRLLEQARTARAVARTAGERSITRLRIGYVPASLPGLIPLALRRLSRDIPEIETSLVEGDTMGLIEQVRDGQLDSAIVPLPAPISGLRVTPLGEQRLVAALTAGDPRAAAGGMRLAFLAPEKIVLMPREVGRGLYDAVLGVCREAGFAPALVELAEGHVERALLAVAAGSGPVILSEAVAERYVAPGLCFVPLEDEGLAVRVVALTRRDVGHEPTTVWIQTLTSTRDGLLPAVDDGVEVALA